MNYYTDDVSGTIIGPVTTPYDFWIDEPRPEWVTRDGKRRIAKGFFESDEQAVEWFKAQYPAEFAAGVEMRVFDR